MLRCLSRKARYFSGVLALSSCLCSPILAADAVWKSVEIDSQLWDVHVVSDLPLVDNFPNRPLYPSTDADLVTDIYVQRQGSSEVMSVPRAANVISLVQSSFRVPATSGSGLDAAPILHPADARTISGAGYPLRTSAYFSDFYVDTFVRSGAEGIDDPDDRTRVYRELFFDMALQPDLADDPLRESRYQTMLDRALQVEGFITALGASADIFETLEDPDGDLIEFVHYEQAVLALANEIGGFLDIEEQSRGPAPSALRKLSDSLQVTSSVTALTAGSARILLLQSMAHERGDLKLHLLEQLYARLDSSGTVDPALLAGLVLARQDLDEYTGDYYDNLANLLFEATLDDPNGVLHLDDLATAAVKRLFKLTSKAAAKVSILWQLNWEVFQGIRAQADRGRTASLAATIHSDLFLASGLQHHRDAMHQGGSLDALEAQTFFELYQMSWYLAARHYRDSLATLNNQISRIWGAGIDLFTGGSYTLQMEDLADSLDRTGMIASRIASTSYLAATQDLFSREEPSDQHAWMVRRLRAAAPPTPTPIPGPMLGVCVTRPFHPASPATARGMNVAYLPGACSDPSLSQAWECSPNDPDGVCDARVQLFWDDDTNPGNADCENGHGPCPIAGADDLHPARSPFLWNAARDGLRERSVYVRAVLRSGDEEVSDYSDGFYQFIDPRFEAEQWSVVGVEVDEGSRSDGDGIPEVGEESSVVLTLRNDSGRPLTGVVVDDLRLEGDAVRSLVTSDWDEAEDADLSYIFDGESTVPDAVRGTIVEMDDDFDFWIASDSEETAIPMVAWVHYWDATNPDRPDLRRIQEIGFTVHVSDGTTQPSLRCGHLDLVEDTDGDLVFESGERGAFTATLCNDGDWEARQVRGIFDSPAPLGEWRDDDAPFPDLGPTECQVSTDDFALRVEPDECGAIAPTMTVEYQGGGEGGLSCALTIACVPHQAIQDDQNLGSAPRGNVISTSIPIANTGAATLSITSAVEDSGAPEVTIVSYPSTLVAGEAGTIEVDIDTSSLDLGLYTRTIVTTSDANNSGERECELSFGVGGGDAPVRITTASPGSNVADLSGNRAVFERGGDIYTVDVNSKVETRITDTPETENQPRIDGDRVVFTRTDGAGGANVILVDLAARSEAALTNLTAAQRSADIEGDRVVWEDRRAGDVDADIYKYDIGSSSLNGELLVGLSSRYAATTPRIDGGYVAYVIKYYNDPGNDSSFYRDMGYRRPNGTVVALGYATLDPPCRVGNRFDSYEHRLAFECDDRDDSENDDLIYALDMSSGAGPNKLTCESGPGDDREEPSFYGDGVLYRLDGDEDLYSVAFTTSGCSTEVPTQIGTPVSEEPAGDPSSGAYVFLDNREDGRQLWGVIPPPSVEVGISGIHHTNLSWVQNQTYDVDVDVRNNGSETQGPLTISLQADGQPADADETTPTLSSGQAATVRFEWAAPSDIAGPVDLTASIDAPPAGDADPGNDSLTLEVTVEDDDDLPPVITSVGVLPAAMGDGDPYIEVGEGFGVTWDASDPAGVASSEIVVDGQTYEGVPTRGATSFGVDVPDPGVGQYTIEFFATDADDSPATTMSPVQQIVTIHPAAPELLFTSPADGASLIDPRTSITGTFSVDMDGGSFDPTTVQLETLSGLPISATLSYLAPSRTLLLEPSSQLEGDEWFRVVIVGGPAGVRDVRQNVLPADESWTFRTFALEALIFLDGFESGDTSSWGP